MFYTFLKSLWNRLQSSLITSRLFSNSKLRTAIAGKLKSLYSLCEGGAEVLSNLVDELEGVKVL